VVVMVKRPVAFLVSALMFSTALVVVPPGAHAAEALPAGFVGQLAAAGNRLAGISLLDELGGTIPGFGTTPAMLFGLHEPLQTLATNVAAATDTDQLEAAILASDIGGYDFANAHAAVNGSVTTLTFDLAANRTATAPLAISTDDVGIAGADFDVAVTMPPTTFTIEFDTSVGPRRTPSRSRACRP